MAVEELKGLKKNLAEKSDFNFSELLGVPCEGKSIVFSPPEAEADRTRPLHPFGKSNPKFTYLLGCLVERV